MEDVIRDVDQAAMQERDVSIRNKNSDPREDALFDSNSDSQSKTETDTREDENFQGENDEESLNHIIEKDPTEAICEVKPDDHANERGHSRESVGNIHQRKCYPCSFDDIEESSVSFCVVCVEYLCKGCTRDHRRSKATRSHTILIDDEIPKDPAVFKMMKSLMYCCDHPEMEVLFKCETHDKFICNKCLVISHRKCEDVKEVSDTALHVQSTISVDNNTSWSGMMQAVYDMTVSVRTAKEENIERLRLDRACIMKEQSEFMKSIEEHLMKLDEISKTEMENMITNELNELEKEVIICKKRENVEKEKIGLLDVAMKYGSTVELNVISELVTKEAEDLKNETKQQAEKAVVRLQFARNQSLTDIASTGTVSVVRGEENEVVQQDKTLSNQEVLEKSSDDIDEASSNARNSPAKMIIINNSDKPKCSLMQSSISKTRTMHDLHHTNDRIWKCSLTSILVLSDGRILVTDHNNECIKILNIDMSVKMEFKLDGKPIDLCQFSKNHLAIIFDGKKMIDKFTVAEETVYKDGGFPSKLYPISIENYNESVSCVIILFSNEERNTPKDSESEIQIRSVHNGEILMRFTDFQTKSSNKLLLKNPSRIQVIPNVQNAFLVSENEKLHYFEIEETTIYTIKEKWYYKSYKASNIDGIADIAVDKEGNIYVCGKDSKNVHQISGTNFKNNRVLLSVHGTPQSLCVDDDRRRLIIGCENDDFIYVVAFQ